MHHLVATGHSIAFAIRDELENGGNRVGLGIEWQPDSRRETNAIGHPGSSRSRSRGMHMEKSCG